MTTPVFDLASLGSKLSVASGNFAGSEYDGRKGVTPLFKLMGFNVGSPLRRIARQIFRRGKDIPRITVKSIRGKPRVGNQMTVTPVESTPFSIAPIGSEPLIVSPRSAIPFRVEPLVVDAGILGTLFQIPGRIEGAKMVEDEYEGIMFGSLAPRSEGDADIEILPSGDSPILIQPVDGAPFLVRMPVDETLAVEPLKRAPEVPDVVGQLALEEEGDPFRLEYVDFDAELAAARSVED